MRLAKEGPSSEWIARVDKREKPIYAAILKSLKEAIRTGELRAGERLPPQRTVANFLDVDLTTVTRAYTDARTQGLVESTIGRGTFVRAPVVSSAGEILDLTSYGPPPPEGLFLGAMLSETISDFARRSDLSTLMSYNFGFGTSEQRSVAVKRWLAPSIGEIASERVLLTPGAQTALFAVFAAVCKPGDAIITDPLVPTRFTGMANQLQLQIQVCQGDDEPFAPEQLERICETKRPSALFVMPTMQNPTAATLSLERRKELARIAAKYDVKIIEADPYLQLTETPVPAIASLEPDRTFLVTTLSKSISPGFRLGYVVSPRNWVPRVTEKLQMLSMLSSPLLAAVWTQWLEEGLAAQFMSATRAEIQARRALVTSLVPQVSGDPAAIHAWIPQESARSSARLCAVAQERGVILVNEEPFMVGKDGPHGVRLSLGFLDRKSLEKGLRIVGEIVDEAVVPTTPVLL